MCKKGAFVLSIVIIIVAGSIAFAQPYRSPHYILTMANIVISGGAANSFNYSIADVEIGNMFAGNAASASYTFKIKPPNEIDSPNPPMLNPIENPTNNPIQNLSGLKDRATSIYMDGYEAVSLDNEATWSHEKILAEGYNPMIITARDGRDIESESVYLAITLDTIPPDIIIDDLIAGAIVTAPQIDVTGTIDEVPFAQEKDLRNGLNMLSIEAVDEAKNRSCETIEIYRARKPIPPPKSK